MPSDLYLLDLYAVLRISSDATPAEIRGAYRRAARASHPDLHPGDTSAAERFKRAQFAYDVLGDPPRRADYDASRRAPVHEPRHASPAAARPSTASAEADEPVSLARELGETVRAIRVMARRSGFRRRVTRLIRYLERL